ncbi:uncharacterized protein LOC119452377 isoform X2 [Dermacentor silvarum]|uniref:uncharacterized protein LOC119452377 isoform X2 n=1 Tax=Dermacentor silvarum TaxID=543639 RepID=UPI002101A542|nr:uncharacterized protein LOC119452377 isoform X2 [Dermacentor silvarum]
MKVPAVISAAFFIVVVPRASLSQYYGDNQYAIPWPLLLSRGGDMMSGRPQHGQNLYDGQFNDNGFPSTGWDAVIHSNNGIGDNIFYHSGLQLRNQEIPQDSWGGSNLLGRGKARGGGGVHNPLPVYQPWVNVIGSYIDGVNTPTVVRGQVKLRQKRQAEFDDDEYSRRRRKQRRRKRPKRPHRGQEGNVSQLGGGSVLGKARRCPLKNGGEPLRFNLKVGPSRR